MKKNKKNLNVILSMILCALLLCSGFHVCSVVEVKADSAGITGFLKNNKTYKYDLNGDKKKEKIKLRVTKRNYYINASFYINGKKVWTMSEKEQWEYVGYKIIKLSNGKRFIYFFAEGPNPGISSHRILQYKKGRMKTVANITDLFKKYQGASMISWYPASENGITVSGKEIKVYFDSMNFTTSTMTYVVSYKYKNGTLVRSHNYGKFSKGSSSKVFTVAKSFNTYRKVGSSSRAFRTKTGERVTIDRYYLKKGNLYIRIRRSNGQKGWIKCLIYSHGGLGKSPLFTNAHYVN